MTELGVNVCVHFGNEEEVKHLMAELKELAAVCR
jgi:hypothetical protein